MYYGSIRELRLSYCNHTISCHCELRFSRPPAIVATNHTVYSCSYNQYTKHLVSRTTNTHYLLCVRTIDTYFPRAIAPLVTVSVLFVAEYEYRTF